MAVKVHGVKNVQNLIDKHGKELEKKCKDIVSATSFVARNKAVSSAPVAFGKLRQGIGTKTTQIGGKIQAEVFSNSEYSVYVEFGTGKKFKAPSNTPKELLKAAEAIRGQRGGNFQDFLTRLSRWARLKGIDQKAVYPIAVSILDNGVEPRPFMRPAYAAAKRYLKAQLSKL